MRHLIYFSLLILVSCSSQFKERGYTVAQLCPAFETPLWHSVNQPKVQPETLLDKQKFAVTSSHKTYWFEARDDYIGLCILPDKIGFPGCATAYATYRLKSEEWVLLARGRVD